MVGETAGESERERWQNVFEDLTGLDAQRAAHVRSCCSVVRTRDAREADLPLDAALVVVESGIVLLTASGTASRTPILAFARRGDMFVPPTHREALVGLGSGSIRILDRTTLFELFAFEGVAPRVIERLGAVVHDRQESLRLASVNPQRERVRQKLLQLAQAHGRVRSDGVRIALPLTHELLARAVGSSRETTTIAMRELRREGFVARSGRGYVVRITARDLEPRRQLAEAASTA